MLGDSYDDCNVFAVSYFTATEVALGMQGRVKCYQVQLMCVHSSLYNLLFGFCCVYFI